MAESHATLNLPDVPVVEFERNFIKTAVCELRFPTLLEFETKPPVQLQKELRKEYPHYERTQSVRVSPGEVGSETKYLFRSKKQDWLVSFKTFAIALETNHYTNFEEFERRLKSLLTKSQPLLDCDFFTRVGLRYINEFTIEDGEVSGWIKDELIAPLAQGVYGDVERFVQEIRGFSKTGRYTLRHGTISSNPKENLAYFLDFDFYEENIQFDSVLPLVSQFNIESFRFFCWAIGAKTQERLGTATPRKAK